MIYSGGSEWHPVDVWAKVIEVTKAGAVRVQPTSKGANPVIFTAKRRFILRKPSAEELEWRAWKLKRPKMEVIEVTGVYGSPDYRVKLDIELRVRDFSGADNLALAQASVDLSKLLSWYATRPEPKPVEPETGDDEDE